MELIDDTKKKMEKTYLNYQSTINAIRAGAPSALLVDTIKFSYHGFLTEIKKVSYISVQGNNIFVKPFDRSDVNNIAEAIAKAQPTLQVKAEADQVRVIVPALSGERRKELVKELGAKTENAKVAIRNIRRDILDSVKKDKQTGEDQRKRLEKDVQKTTDDFIKKIDDLYKQKEKDLLKA